MKILLPSNLDLEEHLRKHPFELPGQRKYQKEYLEYIVSSIYTKPAFNRKILTGDGFVPMNAKKLNKRIWGYQHYLKYLTDTGIFVSNGRYVTKKDETSESKACAIGYKLTESYLSEPKIKNVSEKISLSLKKYDTDLSPFILKKYNYLFKWFNPELKIDHVQAKESLNGWYKKVKENQELWEADESGNKINPLDKFVSNQILIDSIEEKLFQPKFDDFSGRLHTTITSLAKILRPFVTYKDQPLVTVDLCNCQPFLSVVLADPNFWLNNSAYLNSNQLGISSTVREILHLFSLCHPPMVDKLQQIVENHEFSRHKKLVESGEIYTHLLYATNYCFPEYEDEPILIDEEELEEVKTEFITVLNAGNKYASLLKMTFEDEFPSMASLFELIKDKNKKRAARLLQSIERYIFIELIAKRIATEKKNTTIYTIHDGITTTVGNEEFIKKIMKEEIQKATNATPSFKYEYWDKNSTNYLL